jgi:hypothetical protein
MFIFIIISFLKNRKKKYGIFMFIMVVKMKINLL